VCHHPIIFKGLKKITGANYVERIILKAIKNDIAIYACHTNLDNLQEGVNAKIAEKLGIKNCKILVPKNNILYKLFVYAPVLESENIRQTLFAAGAGNIAEYSNCSFETKGAGTFKPLINSNPKIGEAGGQQENIAEVKLEFLIQQHALSSVIKAFDGLTFYEEKAYELIAIENAHQQIGSGMIGNLENPVDAKDFLTLLQNNLGAKVVRHTEILPNKIQKIAFCGGSGSFLLQAAIGAGADVYVSADFKYHEFFDADGKILIADVGHFETEQFTGEIFYEHLRKKFPIFALFLTDINTNPINYFY
jgi:dinuclear metal center YbgI/SA1388 family protein